MSNRYIDYLHSRGLDDLTIDKFNLGFCTTAGRCVPTEFSKFVDSRFYDCVLFPIYDLYNNLISVSARSTEGKGYIHSAYTKHKHLYGLNITHPSILKERAVYIVEGNFDLLTLYKNGITNVVAMLGSKLSLDQIALLSRFTNNFLLATDGDEPGRECTRKISKMLREHSISFEVVALPDRYDPDSFVKENGANAFLNLRQDLSDRIKRISV